MVILKSPGLETFLSICELKTVHAAAMKLGVTQAAATKRLKALEGDLEVTLFLRSRRGMSLTHEGKALLNFCKQTSELEGQFVESIKGAIRTDVSLTLVGPTSALSTRIAKNCAELYQKYSFLRLHLQSDDHSNLVEVIRRGEADVAVVSPSLVPNEMQSKVLKPDRYVLVGPRAWRKRSLPEVLKNERIIDFYETDMTTRRYLEHFKLEKFIRKQRLFVNENEALIQFVSSGIGFATLTESVARPHILNGELVALNEGQILEDPLALVWYPRSRKLPYFEDLIRSIK